MEGKSVLIIEDDRSIQQVVKETFLGAGANVSVASNGEEGLRKFYSQHPDLVVLDIMLPEISGWEVCRQIRHLSDVPIIMLTALVGEESEVQGLDLGAADYVSKPFSPKILLARARAALRQAAVAASDGASLHYADGYLFIDLEARRVEVQGKQAKLTKTEFDLLAYLLEQRGRVLTFEQILQNVWGLGYEDSLDYVHVYVSRLRRKLEENPKEPHYLLSVHGVGYRFEGRILT